MLCLKCHTRPICKVFEIMATTAGLEVEIKSCAYNGQPMPTVCSANDVATEPAVKAAPPRDLNDVSARIKKASAIAAATDSSKDMVECVECGRLIPRIEALVCSSCGKYFCESHSMIDMSSKKPYCEPCWEKAPPAAALPD